MKMMEVDTTNWKSNLMAIGYYFDFEVCFTENKNIKKKQKNVELVSPIVIRKGTLGFRIQ